MNIYTQMYVSVYLISTSASEMYDNHMGKILLSKHNGITCDHVRAILTYSNHHNRLNQAV